MPISPSSYIPRPRGDKPEPPRRLRRKPVRCDEVRLYRRVTGDGKPQWLVTMPAGTYRIEERGQYRSQYFVGDPALWQPLMDELAAQYAADHEHPQQQGPAGARPPPLPTLEIFISNGFEYHCEHCGLRFLAHRIAGNKVRLCSDKCGRERRNAKQRQRRATAQQPAELRADRTCEHCGVAIEVTRSTRRFCSDLCRIRAHYRRHRQAGDD